MKKIVHTITAICMGGLLLASCGMEEMGVGNIPREDGNKDGLPEWNKTKTIEIYFLSELRDATVSNTAPIVSYFEAKDKLCSLGVVDRLDANYSSATNPSTNLDFATGRFSSFALNKYSGTVMQGSTILLNHKVNAQSFFKVTDDCFVKLIEIQAKTTTASPIAIIVPFGTARFDKSEQVSAFDNVLKNVATASPEALIVGTIKSELIESMTNVVSKVANFKLTEVTKNKDTGYSIFMIGLKSWVLRETTVESVSGNMSAYCLKVEASVE